MDSQANLRRGVHGACRRATLADRSIGSKGMANLRSYEREGLSLPRVDGLQETVYSPLRDALIGAGGPVHELAGA